MSTSPRQTVIVPINLGLASNFDRGFFPLSSYRQRDRIGKGDFLLDATLDEMVKITSMRTDPKQWEEIIKSGKSMYDQLKLQQERLQKPKSFLQSLNLRKAWSDYRAACLFLDATKILYMETRTTSEQIRRNFNRELLSVVSHEDIEPAGDDIPPDANITAVAVSIDHPIDDEQERTILDAASSLLNPFLDDPFDDPSGSIADSLSCEWDAASTTAGSTVPSDGISACDVASQPSSPTSGLSIININIVRNSIISPNSTLRETVLHQDTTTGGPNRKD